MYGADRERYGTTITTHEFERVREFLQRETSISLTDDKAYLVETRLSAIMKAHGHADYDALLAAMAANRPQGLRDLVIDAMTTNETLWFRDNAPFDAFRDHLLPAYAAEIQAGSRSRIRNWSAACSTGQEPYSLSMIYDEATRRFPALRPGHLEILATDLSDSALATATTGVYGGMAIQRGLPDVQRVRYFSEFGEGRFAVRPEIRERVVFRKFNLRDSFIMMGSFDIILTRYVLIYFQDDFKREVLRKAQGSLDKGGVLFLGASESLPAGVSGLAMVRRGRATWYQKIDAGAFPGRDRRQRPGHGGAPELSGTAERHRDACHERRAYRSATAAERSQRSIRQIVTFVRLRRRRPLRRRLSNNLAASPVKMADFPS